jgi:hypothetical protein
MTSSYSSESRADERIGALLSSPRKSGIYRAVLDFERLASIRPRLFTAETDAGGPRRREVEPSSSRLVALRRPAKHRQQLPSRRGFGGWCSGAVWRAVGAVLENPNRQTFRCIHCAIEDARTVILEL